MTHKIRWGVLSTAGINRALSGPLRQSRRSKLIAVASRDLAKAKACAAEKGIPRAYGCYQELLDDPEVDAIYNPLPTSIAQAGGEALVLRADVRIEEQVSDALQQIVARWHGLDLAVANAGVQLRGRDDRTHELDLEVWNHTLAINLTGVFLTCKYAIRAMLKSGGGAIILTGSPSGLLGVARGFHAYSASKAGVHGLMRVLAHEYAPDGIRVNAVIPGFTETPLNQMMNAERRQRLLDTIPLQRAGLPEEVAAYMAFLASDDALYVTGAFYTVDGGMTSI